MAILKFLFVLLLVIPFGLFLLFVLDKLIECGRLNKNRNEKKTNLELRRQGNKKRKRRV